MHQETATSMDSDLFISNSTVPLQVKQENACGLFHSDAHVAMKGDHCSLLQQPCARATYRNACAE